MVVKRIGLLALSLALHACARSPGPSPNPRSLVIIVIDTLRQDHLAAYGYSRETAPGLTRLAREASVLDGLSPTSWTRPAAASLLTGLHPLRHQVISDTDAVPPAAVTLPEVLRERGYQTVGVSGNPHVSAEAGFAQGFDAFVLRRHGKEARARSEEINEALTPHLDRLRRPFFLYLHYVDPHAPYEPPRAWDGGPLEARLAARRGLHPERFDPARPLARGQDLLRDMADLYDGEIREVDARIADALGALDARGLLAGTITVVTSDHGEEFEDHGRLSHGRTLHEEMVRVPLIVHAPGLVAPGRHGMASLLDVMPSALALLGIPAPAADGRDLAESLRTGTRRDEEWRSFLFHLDNGDVAALALRRGPVKLLLSKRPYGRALYDLASDPGERADWFEKAPAITADLGRRLASEHNTLVAGALPRTMATLSPGLLEALAAVGYLAPSGFLPRTLPARISSSAGEPRGLLEEAEGFSSCVELDRPTSPSQLLAGWFAPEIGGRWTEPEATVALRWPTGASAAVLELRGVNHEQRVVPFAFGLAGDESGSEVPPGPFLVTRKVTGPGPGVAPVVRIRRPSPFVPAREGLKDDRTLGVFLTAVCLHP